jgi:glycosyltransferase involved in cell wall biosynthesis
MNQIAVIIPCYNEAATIAQVVRDFAAALPGAAIVVGDNNSHDETARLAREAGAMVIAEPRQGKGNMLRTLLQSVEAECYLMVDGDATYPAESARQLCDKVLNEGCDMAIGDRLSSTYFTVNQRRFHNTGNRMMRGLVNWMCHSNVQDILTGYRAMSRRFVKNFPLRSTGFEVETEMTVHALEHSFKVDAVPVDYRDRPEGSHSKLSTWGDGLRAIKTALTLFGEHRPLRFFSIIAAVLLLLALVLVTPVLIEYFQTGLVPRFPTLIVSGFIAMLAMMLWVGGVILEVISRNNWKQYELMLMRDRH